MATTRLSNNGKGCINSHKGTSVRMLIVSDRLPLEAEQRTDQTWSFRKDEDSFLFKLEAGLRDEMLVFHVGSLKVNIHEDKQQEVSKTLLDKLCIPTFLPRDISKNSYCFCKGYLWPLFHSMKHFHIDQPVRPLWAAYVSANRLFSEKVMEVCNPEQDCIWIHDYHLMVLPSFLRQRHVRMKIGFFLHIPFPLFEDYNTFFVKEDIIKCLLNCDVIGFHNYGDALNFLSCCSRILGLQHKLDDGFLEYYGKNIKITVMPVTIDMAPIVSKMEKVKWECQAKTQHLVGKTVLLSIDDIDVFKGTEQRLLAMEHMLEQYPETQGRAVLVQILNPARGQEIHYDSMLHNIRETCERINKTYEKPGYTPIYLLEHRVCTLEKFAYYSIAECLVVTPFEDGLKLYPYEYIACREWRLTGSGSIVRRKSMLVISEFMGCFLSLRGALRVNPWNVEEVAMKMNEAISMNDSHKIMRHTKNYEHIRKHGLISWSKSFYKDMVKAWENQSRVVSIDPCFRKLWVNTMASNYMKAKTRVILLGYDGTLIPIHSVENSPSEDVITTLNDLCRDNRNVVFVVSGREKDSLGEWFKSCKNLGIVAEHGFFMRWPGNEKWETFCLNSDMYWKRIAIHTMEMYTLVIVGSYIERKEHALVWNYQNAHSEFASSQAQKLLNNLEDILANHPVTVKSGKFTVEVETQGVNKGKIVKKILESMAKKEEKRGTFILSIGDDKADEEMFEILNATAKGNLSSPNSVFTCTIGEKPTEAKYYLNDTVEVVHILTGLSVLYFLKESED